MVLSGVVQACMDDVEGNRVIMAEVTAGNTFGESLCFLGIQDSPVYVYASEQAEVVWISLKKIEEIEEGKRALGKKCVSGNELFFQGTKGFRQFYNK